MRCRTALAALVAAAVASAAGEAPAADALRVDQVSAGGNHTCALAAGGRVLCWGSDDEGQLGDDAVLRDRRTPVDVVLPPGGRATGIASGEHHACALLRGGSAICWGEGRFGRLGNGSRAHVSQPTPVRVLASARLTQLTAGTYHSCALTVQGVVLCWGQDFVGQVGDDAGLVDRGRPTPVALPRGRRATQVSAGASHSCAVLDDGAVACWGWALSGRLGDGSTQGEQPIPVKVDLPAGRVARSVSAGGFHTCAVLDDASAWCWGSDDEGQLGDGDAFVDRPRPSRVALPAGRGAEAISAGDHHTCALLDDGALACWGSDADARLGTGEASRIERSTPHLVAGPARRRFVAVSAGFEHPCAVADDGALLCWGSDSDGQLGDDGRIRDRPTPVPVGTPGG
ncbi:MAG: hypothetical protein R3C15_21725 [Thermoleophilia bacterium]